MSNFTLTLGLKTEKWQEDILDRRFNIGRQMYNACLEQILKGWWIMITISAKNFTLTEGIKEKVVNQFHRLEKFISDNEQLSVVLDVNSNRHKAELILFKGYMGCIICYILRLGNS